MKVHVFRYDEDQVKVHAFRYDEDIRLKSMYSGTMRISG